MPTLSYIRLGAPVIPGDLPAAITGVWASAEAPDYAGMAGMVITAGTWSSAEAPDVAAFSAPVPVTGAWSSTEAADAVVIAGGVAWSEITGAWSSGEAGDSAAISGGVTTTGIWASVEAPDTAAIAGGVAWPEITGTWVSGEAGDSAVISGSVTTTGAWASTEAPDVAAFSAPVPLETQLATLLSPGATKLEIMWPDPQYWYQDVAGTVPVTAEGQSVRCWRSLAGASYTQPVNADYAPLASKLPNGAWALSFDGVDDGLRSADPLDMTASDKMAVIVGFRTPAGATADGMLIETSIKLDNNAGTIFLIRRTNGQHEWRSRGSVTFRPVFTSNMSQPNTLVMTGIGDIAAPLSRLRVNGAGLTDSTLSQGLGPFGSHVLYVGRRGGTTLPWKGLLGPLVLRGGPLPDLATVEASEAIINQHMGAY